MNQPYLIIHDDFGNDDYYLLNSEQYIYDTINEDDKREIKIWAKEWYNELVDICETKNIKILKPITKVVFK